MKQCFNTYRNKINSVVCNCIKQLACKFQLVHKVADERINEDCLDGGDDNERKKEKIWRKVKTIKEQRTIIVEEHIRHCQYNMAVVVSDG